MSEDQGGGLPTRKEIGEMLKYLPIFSSKDFKPVIDSKPGEDNWFDEYSKDVNNFRALAMQDCWCDYKYSPEVSFEMIQRESFIEEATLHDVVTMLTFCIRRERVSEGYIGSSITNGIVPRLLSRLEVIRNEMSEQT